MYFTVKSTFNNYLDTFPNFIKSLDNPILTNRMTFEQTLPISLNISKFDNTLLDTFNILKEFIEGYTNCKEIFDFQEKHYVMKLNTSKNFFPIITLWTYFYLLRELFPTSYAPDSVFFV